MDDLADGTRFAVETAMDRYADEFRSSYGESGLDAPVGYKIHPGWQEKLKEIRDKSCQRRKLHI